MWILTWPPTRTESGPDLMQKSLMGYAPLHPSYYYYLVGCASSREAWILSLIGLLPTLRLFSLFQGVPEGHEQLFPKIGSLVSETGNCHKNATNLSLIRNNSVAQLGRIVKPCQRRSSQVSISSLLVRPGSVNRTTHEKGQQHET